MFYIDDKGRFEVRFGRGNVLMATLNEKDDNDKTVVGMVLAPTLNDEELGVGANPIDNGYLDDYMEENFLLSLVFENEESIDVVIENLTKVKKLFKTEKEVKNG